MARETKEQRELRNAEMTRLEEAAKLAFKAAMPARLMQLQADASGAGVNTRVFLTSTGPGIEFTRYEYDNKGSSFEEELNYDSEEWQVEHVERRIREFKEEIEARAARKVMAEEVWKGLRAEQKAAIAEFITYLR